MTGGVRRGVTVLEMVIIVVIVGLLLLIAIPRFTAPTLTVVTAPDSVVAQGASGDVVVRVTDRRGSPQRGVRLQFESTVGGAVTPAEVQTDSTGAARAIWRAAADSGRMRIVAHLAGRTTPEVEFLSRIAPSATSTAVPPAAQPVDSSTKQPTPRTEPPSASPGASGTRAP